MAQDRDSRATIEHLRAQPANGVVRWASDHVSAETPWATGWIDVRIPDDGPPDMSWVWTIVGPDDPQEPEPGELWYFAWPFDLDVHGVFDPAKGWYANELPVPAGRALPKSVVAAYERLARRVGEAYQLDGGSSVSPVGAAIHDRLVSRVGSAYHVRGGWSARTVNDALSAWTARHAGRGDLRFEWDREEGPSTTLRRVMERAAAPDPVWDLGDGLRVVDGLMDELLALHPGEAAEVTVLLREAGRRFHGSE